MDQGSGKVKMLFFNILDDNIIYFNNKLYTLEIENKTSN